MTEDRRPNPFEWNYVTAFVTKTAQPKTPEDQRFLALALFGEAGELANLVKKEWRGDEEPAMRAKLEEEVGDVYAYMRLLALACSRSLHPACVGLSDTREWPNDRHFLALKLCVAVGNLAHLVEHGWISGTDLATEPRLDHLLGYAYYCLVLFANAHDCVLDTVLERVTIPKIQARWGSPQPAPAVTARTHHHRPPTDCRAGPPTPRQAQDHRADREPAEPSLDRARVMIGIEEISRWVERTWRTETYPKAMHSRPAQFRHAHTHAVKALGKIAAVIDHEEHGRHDQPDLEAADAARELPKLLADLINCAVRMAEMCSVDLAEAYVMRARTIEERWHR